MSRLRRYRPDVVQSPLETYLREINETALLTADQEKDLARKIGEGSTEARDQMVRANLRLVVNIARGYTGKGLALQDLIEEGNLGLLRAVEGFDPTMNTRFSTYASYWINRASAALVTARRSIPAHGRVARRAPGHLNKLLTNRPPADARSREAARPAEEETRIIKKAIACNAAPQSDQTEAGWSIDEMLMDSRSKTPDTEMVETDDLKHVLILLEKMDKREATVLKMRFGLNDEEPKTLKEIGECLGLTRERVRQIESEALAKLSEDLSGE